MVSNSVIGREDERSTEIGRRAATNAYVALSGLLLAVVVRHVFENGLTNIGAVGFELAGFALGLIVYVVTGLYYTRTT
jgi:uncharacterized membrane protein